MTSFVSAFLVERSRPTELPEDEFPSADAFELEPLNIVRGTHSVSGTVSDHLGRAAAGVTVHLRVLESEIEVFEPMFFDHTSDDGVFEIGHLPAGSYELMLLATGVPNSVETVTVPWDGDMRLAIGEPWSELRPAPEVVRGILQGVIKYPTELDPPPDLSGYEVYLAPQDEEELWRGAVERRATTEKDGRFTIVDLAVANYDLTILPPWARGGSWPYLAEIPIPDSLVVPESGAMPELVSAVPVNLVIGEVSGTLLDVEGRPLEGALLKLQPIGEELGHQIWPAAISGVEGTFRIRDLPIGHYQLEVTAGAASEPREVHISSKGERFEARFGPIDPRPDE